MEGFLRPPEYPLRLRARNHPVLTLPDPGPRLLDALTVGDWAAIVPGLLDDESRRAAELVDLEVLCRMAAEVVHAVAGVEFHTAARLAMAVTEHRLDFLGWCAGHGFDPGAAPVHRVLGAAYAWLVAPLENASAMADPKDLEKARSRFDAEIGRRLPVPALYPVEVDADAVEDDDAAVPEARRWSMQEEAASFEATMAAFGRFQGA